MRTAGDGKLDSSGPGTGAPRDPPPRQPAPQRPHHRHARHRADRRRDRPEADRRRRDQGDHAPATARGRDPPAGARQEPRPGARCGRDLPRVEVPRRDLLGRRQGPDADPAEHRSVHRPPQRGDPVRVARSCEPADQHLLRELVPALPARPLRRQRGGCGRGVQRRARAGRRLGRRDADAGRHPLRRDRGLRPRRDRQARRVPGKYRSELGL